MIPLLILLLLLTGVSCGSESSGKPQSENAAPKKQVRVAKSVEGKLERTVSVSGTLAAEEEVQLGMKVQGRIQQIFVDLGSAVRRGQPLLKLEPRDFELRMQQASAAYQQARVRLGLSPESEETDSVFDPEQTGVVRQAKAQLQQATLTRNRMESLHKDGLVARSEFDDAEAAYQVAEARYQDALEEVRNRQGLLIQRKAELDLARKQLTDSTLTAPMDGSIQERHVSPGQFVAVGDTVLTMVRVHPLRLKLALPERESGLVRVGQTVKIQVEGDDKTYSGTLRRISPAITTDNRTLTVEAEIPNENGHLRAGSFARAEIVTQPQAPAILAPASSVITFAGITKVIVVENNTTAEKRVRVGRRLKEQVEIVEGLSAGEAVVIQPGNLAPGEPVSVIW